MNVKDAVFQAFNNVIEEANLSVDVTDDTALVRNNGMDSLGFVNFIVEIEEILDVTLDDAIPKIRKCLRLKDVVSVIEDVVNV